MLDTLNTVPKEALFFIATALALAFAFTLVIARRRGNQAAAAESNATFWQNQHGELQSRKDNQIASLKGELGPLRDFKAAISEQRRIAGQKGNAASQAAAAAKREAKAVSSVSAPKLKTATKSDRGAARKKRG